MSLENLLTVGAITQILEDQKPSNPVLQIIGYKPMTPDQMAFGAVSDELRYRLMIGDGIKNHQYCVITNQDIVEDIKNGRLEKWSVIRVTSYRTVDYGDSPENKRRLIYILNLEIVKRGFEVGQKIVCQQPTAAQPDSTNMQTDTKPTYISPNNKPMQSINPQPQVVNYNEPTQPQPYPVGNQPDLIKSPRSMRASHEFHTIGIGELTPYIGKWVVKGRVTSKSGIREYNNAKGGGKLFNFTLTDKSGEIKITAFNADCERVFAYVEPNKVYVLGKGTVKNADKRYTNADYEITLNSDSLLEEVIDSKEANDIPLAKFNFISIASLANIPPNQPVDMIGAITQVSEVSTVISKTKNKELKKRNIIIVDMSRHTISVTLWGEQSESFTGGVGDVFVTKAARIGTYGGRSASAGDCVFVNPDIPEVRKMKNWYANLLDTNFTSLTSSQDGMQGGGDQWKPLDQMLNLEQVRTIASSGQQSALYAKCRGWLMSVGKNPVYKCCPTEGCGKKLVDTQNGEMKCEKCQQTYSSYKYRYKTDIEISDRSTSSWVTLWDDKAEFILKMKPEELERYMKMDNKDAYEKIITNSNFIAFIFTLKSRIDNYNNEERVKLQVISMVKVEPVSMSKVFIDEIKKMAAH